MNSTIQDICMSCDESPLSTTGNVTGILTFTLGLIVSCGAFFSIIRNADSEIKSLQDTVNEMEGHIFQMATHIGRLELRHNQVSTEMHGLLIDVLKRFQKAQKKASCYLRRFENTDSLWTRIKWWYMEKETAAHMASLESYNQRVTAIQLTFLLRTADDNNRQILKNVIPIKEEVETGRLKLIDKAAARKRMGRCPSHSLYYRTKYLRTPRSKSETSTP
ncbi:hypothetical protein QBC38DRAFT_288817 [Podospora fimiseda]|uniref:Uncharacterized protein n=1 Tax=Podospora fimiseda TaxID=252190 RepID=A0AAN7BK79_9PEZI|nr:hypothetical protein QBC38DRAFT_288817 [Podospora fimiseda]